MESLQKLCNQFKNECQGYFIIITVFNYLRKYLLLELKKKKNVIFKVWDLFHQADNVREMLTRLIQEEALRTYLFTYSHVYDSISMPILGEMFDLDRAVVHSIISKMIINEELMVSLSIFFSFAITMVK